MTTSKMKRTSSKQKVENCITGALTSEEYDNHGFKVRKCKGGLEILFEFLLEGQGAAIHVLLHNEVTAKRHALFRSEHKIDPLTW